MAALLTLLTDFGTDDGYAGALLGAVLRVAPRLRVETITHGIPPGDIAAGAYWLAAAAPSFPEGSVHCVVVDPGVGTSRPLVGAILDQQLVLAPDNGLLHFLWQKSQQRLAVRVDQAAHQQGPVSATFHGRDVIGPLAARVAAGILRLEQLGPRIPSPQLIPELLPQGDTAGTATRVVVVDRFGDAVLAVARTPWYEPLPASASLPDGRRVDRLVRTYAEIGEGVALLWNSSGHLEIAGNRISAADRLGLHVGDRVRVAWAAAESAEPHRARASGA